mgnify:CR=1 FL=1|tara:strand:+ start:843 stop:1247 length:405 start_codon:yes stop_codon:yes gene_type:complete
MKIIGLEHIGIAVNSLDSDAKFWNEVMEFKKTHSENLDNQGVRIDIYDSPNCKIELLLSMYQDTPVGRFIKRHGKGIHHICFEVENIQDTIDNLKQKNIKLIGDEILTGAKGYKVIFIHPKSAGGVLVEFAERV